MAPDGTDLIAIDALGPDGAYGPATASLSSPPMASPSLNPAWLRRCTSRAPSMLTAASGPCRRAEREAALAKAADAFSNGMIAGLDFDAYTLAASRILGVPISVTRARRPQRCRRCRIGLRRGASGPADRCDAGLAR